MTPVAEIEFNFTTPCTARVRTSWDPDCTRILVGDDFPSLIQSVRGYLLFLHQPFAKVFLGGDRTGHHKASSSEKSTWDIIQQEALTWAWPVEIIAPRASGNIEEPLRHDLQTIAMAIDILLEQRSLCHPEIAELAKLRLGIASPDFTPRSEIAQLAS